MPNRRLPSFVRQAPKPLREFREPDGHGHFRVYSLVAYISFHLSAEAIRDAAVNILQISTRRSFAKIFKGLSPSSGHEYKCVTFSVYDKVTQWTGYTCAVYRFEEE